MTPQEAVLADYEGTGMTTGVQPVGLFRPELTRQGVSRAAEVPGMADGRWVQVAGIVIVRQRPGTAKGFFFLTLEDETGLANVVVTPRRYEEHRTLLVTAPALVVEGPLQNRDGVATVKAVRFRGLLAPETPALSRDFR